MPEVEDIFRKRKIFFFQTRMRTVFYLPENIILFAFARKRILVLLKRIFVIQKKNICAFQKKIFSFQKKTVFFFRQKKIFCFLKKKKKRRSLALPHRRSLVLPRSLVYPRLLEPISSDRPSTISTTEGVPSQISHA